MTGIATMHVSTIYYLTTSLTYISDNLQMIDSCSSNPGFEITFVALNVCCEARLCFNFFLPLVPVLLLHLWPSSSFVLAKSWLELRVNMKPTRIATVTRMLQKPFHRSDIDIWFSRLKLKPLSGKPTHTHTHETKWNKMMDESKWRVVSYLLSLSV